MIEGSNFLDLRSVPCPLNIVKCKLALEKVSSAEILFIKLDKGEPEVMVKKSVLEMGYKLKLIEDEKTWVKLAIAYEFD